MKIISQKIPDYSLLQNTLSEIHYSDCYTGYFFSKKNIRLDDCVKVLLIKWPWWVNCLFWIRNVAISPFGMEKADINKLKNNYNNTLKLSIGSSLLFFTVHNLSDNEIVLIATDSHLSGFFSMILIPKGNIYQVTFSTIVRFNNTFGRIYFFFIKPFHKLITKSLIRNFIKHINQL